MGGLSTLSTLLLAGLCVAWACSAFELVALWLHTRRRPAPPKRWPSFSILKPLAGLDDELSENLESHLRLDYPGELELLLGVKSEADPAWPLAQAFAQAHPGRVRLCVQEGEPGLNPKVNQLITLTRHAKHEVIALTDSNIRVPPNLLREHAALLEEPKTGLTSCAFVGVGEEALGAALDNMTLASFAAPAVAAAHLLLQPSQIIGKSFAVKREALEAAGGWEPVKDVLAEDQRLGLLLRRAGYQLRLLPTVVHNVQRRAGLSHFVDRNARWAMLRFRMLRPGVYLEPLLNLTLWAVALVASAPGRPFAWGALLASVGWSMLFTQWCAYVARGRGFSLKWLGLVPVRDLLFFGVWLWGAALQTVVWRGHRLRVGHRSRLSRVEEPARAPWRSSAGTPPEISRAGRG